MYRTTAGFTLVFVAGLLVKINGRCLKVLIVNTYQHLGGAARAAFRLFEALNAAGVESEFLHCHSAVAQVDMSEARFYEALPVLAAQQRPHSLFSCNTVSHANLVEYINQSDADVVHLHWLADGFISIEDLQAVQKPLVFSLHDMWLFTAGCHYTQGCEQFRQACSECHLFNQSDYQRQRLPLRDILQHNWHRKAALFRHKMPIMVVGLSRWITEQARLSNLLSETDICTLPNPIDPQCFFPDDNADILLDFGVPVDKPLVLFGAINGTQDPRKGYKHLQSAFSQAQLQQDVRIVTFGNRDYFESRVGNIDCINLPVLDNVQIRQLLSHCKMLILPSEQENLSNMVMESLACGTPVVAFDIGGNADMIIDGKNGRLASVVNSETLANEIANVLLHGVEWTRHTIHQDTISRFGYFVVAGRYQAMYKRLLQGGGAANQCYSQSLLSPVPGPTAPDTVWVTAHLRRWVEELKSLPKPAALYGFGRTGQILLRLIGPQHLTAVVDRQAPTELDIGLPLISACDMLPEETRYIVMSLADKNNKIKQDVAAQVKGQDITIIPFLDWPD